jgi:hypothetical protein
VDFRIAAPALVMLKALPVDARAVPEWLGLLRAPDVAVRRLALDKVGDRDTAAVAEALVDQLGQADRSLRDAAVVRLTRLEHGRKALTRALLEADSPDRAWTLARAQAPFVKDYQRSWRDSLFASASKHLEAGDRQADPLLFLLRESNSADLAERLQQRALILRKKKDYPRALFYLRILARDPGVGFAVRWELAACGLKVSEKEVAAEARTADPSLQQFAHLALDYQAEVDKELAKARWLDADDLYYLGFHLAEKEGAQKRLAGRVLHLLLQRSPRSKLAKAARAKLRSEGLE